MPCFCNWFVVGNNLFLTRLYYLCPQYIRYTRIKLCTHLQISTRGSHAMRSLGRVNLQRTLCVYVDKHISIAYRFFFFLFSRMFYGRVSTYTHAHAHVCKLLSMCLYTLTYIYIHEKWCYKFKLHEVICAERVLSMILVILNFFNVSKHINKSVTEQPKFLQRNRQNSLHASSRN